MPATTALLNSLTRQVNHWLQAAIRLSAFDNLASANAWYGVNHSISAQLKSSFKQSIDEVIALGNSLTGQLNNNAGEQELRMLKRGLLQLRSKYLKTEETINFYTVAINSRTTPGLSAILRACDVLCLKSMEALLRPLGKQSPLVLTYMDKGIGASILKAGLTLWDGNTSTIATIKVTYHNISRPTALIHETGHQVAHILNWTTELSEALAKGLSKHPEAVAHVFSSWASEIAADAFAFVHTGYAATASLNDVISGEPFSVFSYHRNDPHPISYVRLLLNTAMCRAFYGDGEWNNLEDSFKNEYDINLVNYPSVKLIRMCVEAIPEAVDIILKKSYSAFGNRSLSQLISPEMVSPRELEKLAYVAGPSLFTSHAWINKECIRLLALNGYKIGTGKGNLPALYKQQEEWMTMLGFAVELN